MLLQAGRDVENPDAVGQKVEVKFPNSPPGKGYVDCVLRADHGQPLAVVEANIFATQRSLLAMRYR